MNDYNECVDLDLCALVSKYRQCIMGFAALRILLFHEWQFLFSEVPVLRQLEWFAWRIGFFGVDVCFFLSGMGLVHSDLKHGVGFFYLRRLKRVYVPFLTMGVIYAIAHQWDWMSFLESVLGIAFVAQSIYAYLWFVPAIMILYLLYPWYYRFFEKCKEKERFLLMILLVWLVLSNVLQPVMRSDLYGFTNRIPIFLTGIYLGWYSKEHELRLTKGCLRSLWVLLLLGLILCGLANAFHMYILVPTSNCALPTYVLTIAVVGLLAWMLEKISTGTRLQKFGDTVLRVLSFYGSISLELYCVQELLGSKLIPWMNQLHIVPIVMNLLSFVVISCAGWLLSVVVKQIWKLPKYFGAD